MRFQKYWLPRKVTICWFVEQLEYWMSPCRTENVFIPSDCQSKRFSLLKLEKIEIEWEKECEEKGSMLKLIIALICKIKAIFFFK